MDIQLSKKQITFKAIKNLIIYTLLITALLFIAAFFEDQLEDYILGPELPPVFVPPPQVASKANESEILNEISAPQDKKATEADLAEKLDQIPKKQTTLTQEDRLKILQGLK